MNKPGRRHGQRRDAGGSARVVHPLGGLL